MNIYIIIGIFFLTAVLIVCLVCHQHQLAKNAWLMNEAIRNCDFTLRLSTRWLLPGERALVNSFNLMGERMNELMKRNETESWEQLTRLLTHEITNEMTPIISISQTLLGRADVKGSPIEDGIQAIYNTSRHLSEFVVSYRKMSRLDKPSIDIVFLRPLLDNIANSYPELSWKIDVPAQIEVVADAGMMRQVILNLAKNAIEAKASRIVVTLVSGETANNNLTQNKIQMYIGNDGQPIPAEDRQSLFVPFFTTKTYGNGIGLSVSRRMMLQQGGMLELADRPVYECNTAFLLTISCKKNND